jgi:MarR family transcriptional regulator, 2-MHQ and catechol-resistance regulon repressor
MPTHFKGSAQKVRALNAYITLLRAAETVQARAADQIRSLGLTLPQFGVLESLLHLGPLSQTRIGEKWLRSAGNVTLVVDNLERRGWVRRRPLPADRRTVVVSLTSRGRARIRKVFPDHADLVARIFRGLAPREQEQLHRLCRKLGLAARSSRTRSKGEIRQ